MSLRATTAAGLVALALLGAYAHAPPRAADRLDPASQPKIVNALPNPLTAAAAPDTARDPGVDDCRIRMQPVEQELGLVDPDTGKPLRATVWGYAAGDARAMYPGPTIEARRRRPVRVCWENALPEKHLLPVDTTVPCGPDATHDHSHCRPFVRTVVHLHGGHVPDHSDGYPEAWFSPRSRNGARCFAARSANT